MNTDALDALVRRCNEMDITEQLEYLGDAMMPHAAASQLAALKARIAELEKETGEADKEHAKLVEVADLYQEAKTRVAELEHPWQPISSAPKDGTDILVVDVGNYPVIGYYRKGWMYGEERDISPIHWMPIPALPESEE